MSVKLSEKCQVERCKRKARWIYQHQFRGREQFCDFHTFGRENFLSKHHLEPFYWFPIEEFRWLNDAGFKAIPSEVASINKQAREKLKKAQQQAINQQQQRSQLISS